MCYIQVSEHLRGQAAAASMRQGRISSVFQEYSKTFMIPSFKWNVYENKNQFNCISKTFDVFTNDMILCLWTELLDIISTGGGGGGVGGK